MTGIFLKLLNMSVAASWLVFAVMLLRLLLKKSPKWISCLLWGIVALRLIMPVSVQSLFSLIPSAQVIPQDIAVSQTPAIHSGIPQINSAVNPILTQQVIRGEDTLESVLLVLSMVWAAGVALMLLYSAATYLRLRLQVRASIAFQKNVYVCDDVRSPFILGTFFPRIYIPSGIDDQQLQYVLAHENAHIKRLDHWWKPVGFLLLSVYWFNPLLWLAYILLCRDIERACDEKVIAGMDNDGKKGYAEALVACSVHHRTVMACPVAFGEVGVKSRIKGIVRYKKPAIWIIGVSILACMLTAACFLTDPIPCAHLYRGRITVDATCTSQGMQTLTCELCQHSYAVPAQLLAHAYDAGVVDKEPTCTHVGSRKLTCTGCGAVKTEQIEKTAHTAGTLTVTKEPNCTNKGEVSSICTACQTIFVVQVLETNGVHDLNLTVLRKATCSDAGSAFRTCTRCDHTENYTLDQPAHTYKTTYTVEPDCGHVGTRYQECIDCGHLRSMTIPKSNEKHDWVHMGYSWPDVCSGCGAIRPGSENQYYINTKE